MKSRLLGPSLLLLLPFLASCGDSTSAPVPDRIVITPGNVTLEALGLTQQFSAQVEDKKGKVLTEYVITWNSLNESVASVSASGLATGLRRGTTSIQAVSEGLTGSAVLNISPVPAGILKEGGDGQTGALSQELAEDLEIQVSDSQGNPVEGASVSFNVLAGNGSVSPVSRTTDAQGRASTRWTLGCSNDDPQRARASAGGAFVEFTASADLSLPAICQESIPRGRVTFPYSVQLLVVGGDQPSMTWTLESGSLPNGVVLASSGLLSGTPTGTGSFTFRARAQDGMGASAARDFGFRVCDAPTVLSAGESAFLDPSGSLGCGFFLPSGNPGDRYRVGVLWANSNEADTLATSLPLVTVSISREQAMGAPAQPVPVQRFSAPQDQRDWLESLPESLREAIEVDIATESFHHALREQEWRMIRGFGPQARPLPDRTGTLLAPALQSSAPEKLSLISNPESECSPAAAKTTALKVAENDHMVFYQDSAQAEVDSLRVTTALAEMMLDYYRDFGKQVIDDYFGGVSDLDSDGRVVVLATPVVDDDVAAYVWSGDFFPKVGTGFTCPNSNEMELVRFNPRVIRGMMNGNYQALATMVHEVKHVSSLYKSIIRFDAINDPEGYQPSFIEEGTAEIAGEVSSRLAWVSVGGPPLTALVDASARSTAYDAGTGAPLKEAYGVLLRWARTIGYLGSQPNGVVGTPVGAGPGHSVYGSGWHFHRWLGDAFGNASAMTMGDASFFTSLNDSMTPSGPQGIKNVTGLSWQDLMDRYASAIMLNGTGAPQPEWGFSSYHLPDATDALLTTQRDGFYPWPVNVQGDNTTSAFASLLNAGSLGPSGIRVYDLTSDGSGLGIDVRVETTRNPVRVVVVRIQ